MNFLPTFLLVQLISVTVFASTPTTIFVRGNVVTLDKKSPRAQAIALSDDRVLAVGTDKEIRALLGPNTKVIDLKGKTVVPGLVDAHAHLVSLGLTRTRVDFTNAKSETEAVEMLRRTIAETPAGQWIQGENWNQNNWPGKQFPTAASLDKISPDHPVFLSRIDGHASWVNTKAMKLASLNASTKDPSGGKIIRTPDGKPTGVLIDNAQDLVSRIVPPPSRKDIEAAFRRAFAEATSLGVTAVHDMGMNRESLSVLQEMAAKEKLPLRVQVYLSGSDKELVNEWFKAGPQISGHGGYVTVRGVKMFADGALGSRGAALLSPYLDDPGNSGLLMIEKKELKDASVRALKAGFQIATHAIGDRANRLVLDAYEEAFKEYPTNASPRFRIEHAQILDAKDIARFGKLGVVASMQATHCTSDMPWVPARIGEKRAKQGAYSWRSFLKSGAVLANGSDAPVESINPVLGLYASVTRQDVDGKPHGGWLAGQKLTIMEALRSFTQGPAQASFEEGSGGTIAAGKLADFSVFGQDITKVSSKRLKSARVEMTVVGGRVVFDANASKSEVPR
jgi:predicted amidohydrolase YtcJ